MHFDKGLLLPFFDPEGCFDPDAAESFGWSVYPDTQANRALLADIEDEALFIKSFCQQAQDKSALIVVYDIAQAAIENIGNLWERVCNLYQGDCTCEDAYHAVSEQMLEELRTCCEIDFESIKSNCILALKPVFADQATAASLEE